MKNFFHLRIALRWDRGELINKLILKVETGDPQSRTRQGSLQGSSLGKLEKTAQKGQIAQVH